MGCFKLEDFFCRTYFLFFCHKIQKDSNETSKREVENLILNQILHAKIIENCSEVILYACTSRLNLFFATLLFMYHKLQYSLFSHLGRCWNARQL